MAKEIVIDFRELATMIIREHQIKEGLWGIWVRFGIGGANVGPDEASLVPAAVVPIQEIGIQRFDAPNGLTVDAANVWKVPSRARAAPVTRAKAQGSVKRRAATVK